ncbi:Hypothetical protein A7982_04526 [Minicystis rosea]|nr:Hypothetical protein A7982_04526 [Minicystis rosea]
MASREPTAARSKLRRAASTDSSSSPVNFSGMERAFQRHRARSSPVNFTVRAGSQDHRC